MIVFANNGILDPRVITTMGVNVKPNSSSPIGYFGTGLKYAIATALREGGTITIRSGLAMYEFFTQKAEIRGKEFDLVYMQTIGAIGQDGQIVQLPFTLELGKNWERWMVVRELYSNCMDEGGEVRVNDDSGGWETKIDLGGFDDDWAGRGEWLLMGEPFEKSEGLWIWPGESSFVYYHGIRVTKLDRPTKFTYDIRSSQRLSEDRTLDTWTARSVIARSMLEDIGNRGVLKAILTADGQCHFEGGMEYPSWGGEPSEAFLTTIKSAFQNRRGVLNKSALDLARRHIREELVEESSPISEIEQEALDKALKFLKEIIGFRVEEEIVVQDSLGDHWIQGMAAGGKIYLAKASFGKGTKFLASTLLEEHLHISEGLVDESRGMQDRLFDLVISMGERLQGRAL